MDMYDLSCYAHVDGSLETLKISLLVKRKVSFETPNSKTTEQASVLNNANN